MQTSEERYQLNYVDKHGSHMSSIIPVDVIQSLTRTTVFKGITPKIQNDILLNRKIFFPWLL